MLRETGAPLHYRRAAATALGEAGDASGVDALMDVIQDPDKRIALNALRSVIKIGGEAVAGRLVPLIGTRDHLDGLLFYYFSHSRHTTAKPKLEEILATKTAAWLRERIEKAILFQIKRRRGRGGEDGSSGH